jgi:hypothetical protein
VEAVNKYLKAILQKNVRKSKSNWKVMLYPVLWAYQTVVNTSTSFSPFHLVHRVDSILPIECEIPSLKLAIELLPKTIDLKERLVHMEKLYKKHRDTTLAIKENKHRVKV